MFTSKTQTRLIAKRPCLVYFCGDLVVLASFTFTSWFLCTWLLVMWRRRDTLEGEDVGADVVVNAAQLHGVCIRSNGCDHLYLTTLTEKHQWWGSVLQGVLVHRDITVEWTHLWLHPTKPTCEASSYNHPTYSHPVIAVIPFTPTRDEQEVSRESSDVH